MVRKTAKGLLSLVIVLLMISGMAVTGKLTAGVKAASGPIKVEIADVERYYTDSKKILDMINEYRAEKNTGSVTMDTEHLEAAMVRAAELSLYASEYCPNGQKGTARIPNSLGGGQIVAYDVHSLYALMTSLEDSAESRSILLDSGYKSVGVGVVKVDGYKFVCILMSGKKPTAVSSDTLNQITETNQVISTLPEIISEMSAAYPDESGVSVGSSLPAYVMVENKLYPSVSVYLTSYNASVTFSENQIFEHENKRLVAVNPGLCTVRITFGGNQNLSAACVLKSIGLLFGNCKFPTIPDQTYTGSAIKPSVVITDKSGARLVSGTDYKLTYKNNVNVGTATITVTGIGKYAGQEKNLYFNIVKGGDDPTKTFSVSATTSASEAATGEYVTISVHVNGGKSPYKFTYQYSVGNTSSWTTIKSASTDTTCMFAPKQSGTNYLKVQATDGNGSSSSQTLILKVYEAMTLTANVSETTAEVDSIIKITASAKGGKAPLEYAYYVQKPYMDKVITLKDYSDSQTSKFRVDKAGKYIVTVKLRGAVGDVVTKNITVEAVEMLMKNTSQISSKEIDLGQSITLYGKSTNGTDVNYAYFYKPSSEESWRTIKSYSTTASTSLKPTAAGTYDILIKAKDASGFIAKSYFTLKVHKTLTNTSKMSAGTIYLGNSVKFTFSAINGSGSYKYAVYLKKGSETSYSLKQSYTTNTTYTFKPSAKGNYYFKVKVKDSINNVVTKDFSLKVQVPLSMTASVSSTSIKSGQSVTVTGSSSGGTSPYQMAVYYKKPGASNFTKASDYASTKTRTFKLSTKGKFTFRIKMKDSASNVVSKNIVVTVE